MVRLLGVPWVQGVIVKEYLLFDVCRCVTEDCPSKQQCLRYTCNNIGPRTPFAQFDYDKKSGKCGMFIGTQE